MLQTWGKKEQTGIEWGREGGGKKNRKSSEKKKLFKIQHFLKLQKPIFVGGSQKNIFAKLRKSMNLRECSLKGFGIKRRFSFFGKCTSYFISDSCLATIFLEISCLQIWFTTPTFT